MNEINHNLNEENKSAFIVFSVCLFCLFKHLDDGDYYTTLLLFSTYINFSHIFNIYILIRNYCYTIFFTFMTVNQILK